MEPALGHGIVLLVALQRGVEALVSRRNLRRLVERGGRRVERDGTAGLVLFHVAWFAAMLVEREALGARLLSGPALAAVVASLALVEALRVAVLATLGARWTIQVVVVPGEAPVRRGPYRFLAHPNYAVVLLEVLLVSLLVGAWRSAALGVPVVALLLRSRIRREERAWAEAGARLR
jgi:methyltransferase